LAFAIIVHDFVEGDTIAERQGVEQAIIFRLVDLFEMSVRRQCDRRFQSSACYAMRWELFSIIPKMLRPLPLLNAANAVLYAVLLANSERNKCDSCEHTQACAP
jgi:hypothetical protein